MAGQAKIIDGKAYAVDLRARVGLAVAQLKSAHGLTPGLAVVVVGEDPASQIYVRNKAKQTRAAGMNSFEHRLDAAVSEQDLLELLDELNGDPAVHGILVQLPLPEQIDTAKVIDKVDPAKDVDGFHVVNAGKLLTGRPGLAPCTPLGCVMLAKNTLGDLAGLDAVIVGRSNIVGKPLAHLLLAENCTVTIAHSRTRNLPDLCRRADILVAAVGKAQMIKASWVKPGACVIDVGINRIPAEDGKTRLVGDVDFDDVITVAGAITPVPGGVGPMTIACLLDNTLKAAAAQAGVDLMARRLDPRGPAH